MSITATPPPTHDLAERTMQVSYLNGIDVVKNAKRRLGARYRFGAERTPGDNTKRPIDCSELVEMTFRELGLYISDGSWNQIKECRRCNRAQAANIPGALCFYRKSRWSRISHVGISTGQGNVIEANGALGKVVIRPIGAFRWTEFGLPKVLYEKLS